MPVWKSRFVLVAVTAASLLYGAAPVAQAAFPGANGKIAFSDPSGGIWAIDPDGTDRTAITVPPPYGVDGYDIEPAWTADGSRIAYVRFGLPLNALWGDIFTVDATGSGQVRLTNNSTKDLEPAWSPDGHKIAFSRCLCGLDGDNEIYTMNADGTGLMGLTMSRGTLYARDFNPAWSPDGTKIAFQGISAPPFPFGGPYGIYVMAADGSEETRIVNGRDPDWSPDGRKIAGIGISSVPGISVMNADGTGQVRLTSNPDDGNPVWSPDGTKIAFHRFLPTTAVFTMNADGTGLALLASGRDPDWQPLPGPKRSDYKNTSQFCKAEREFKGESAFAQSYGANGDGSNAFGKCVSADDR
jgi:Tol biopolymer transport system component